MHIFYHFAPAFAIVECIIGVSKGVLFIMLFIICHFSVRRRMFGAAGLIGGFFKFFKKQGEKRLTKSHLFNNIIRL